MTKITRVTYRQIFTTTILLMVMMLHLGVKTFHQHHSVDVVRVICIDCEHHPVHDGHILNLEGCSEDCVVCQLFSTPYNKVRDVLKNVIPIEHLIRVICNITVVHSVVQMHASSRAPPTFLL